MSAPSIDTFDILSELWKARARLAIYAAYTSENSNDVNIRISPTKGVVATQAAKAKAIKLVPMTASVVIAKDSDPQTLPTMTSLFKHTTTGDSHGATLATPKLVVDAPPIAKQGTCKGIAKPILFGPAYWFVHVTRDQAEANMAPSIVKVTVAADECQEKLSVPILQNTRPVAAGEELLVYKPKAQDRDTKADESALRGGKGDGKRAASSRAKASAAKAPRR